MTSQTHAFSLRFKVSIEKMWFSRVTLKHPTMKWQWVKHIFEFERILKEQFSWDFVLFLMILHFICRHVWLESTYNNTTQWSSDVNIKAKLTAVVYHQWVKGHFLIIGETGQQLVVQVTAVIMLPLLEPVKVARANKRVVPQNPEETKAGKSKFVDLPATN